MIIYTKNGLQVFEKRSDKPDSDWTGHAEHVIAETVPENKELLEKVMRYAPYFEVISSSDGNIYDVVKTADKPQPVRETATLEEKIAQVEAQLAEMKSQLIAEGGTI